MKSFKVNLPELYEPLCALSFSFWKAETLSLNNSIGFNNIHAFISKRLYERNGLQNGKETLGNDVEDSLAATLKCGTDIQLTCPHHYLTLAKKQLV